MIIPGFSYAPTGRKGPANVETVLISLGQISSAIYGKIKSASIRPKPLIWSMRPPLSSNPKTCAFGLRDGCREVKKQQSKVKVVGGGWWWVVVVWEDFRDSPT